MFCELFTISLLCSFSFKFILSFCLVLVFDVVAGCFVVWLLRVKIYMPLCAHTCPEMGCIG